MAGSRGSRPVRHFLRDGAIVGCVLALLGVLAIERWSSPFEVFADGPSKWFWLEAVVFVPVLGMAATVLLAIVLLPTRVRPDAIRALAFCSVGLVTFTATWFGGRAIGDPIADWHAREVAHARGQTVRAAIERFALESGGPPDSLEAIRPTLSDVRVLASGAFYPDVMYHRASNDPKSAWELTVPVMSPNVCELLIFRSRGEYGDLNAPIAVDDGWMRVQAQGEYR